MFMLTWIIFFCCWFKTYQRWENLVGYSSVKFAGWSLTNPDDIYSNTSNYTELPNNSSDLYIWDSKDVVYPAYSPQGAFVTTNYIQTTDQSRGYCDSVALSCTSDANCTDVTDANGWVTGTCNTTSSKCEVRAWCPIQDDTTASCMPQHMLSNIADWSVTVKIGVTYPHFGAQLNTYAGDTQVGYNTFVLSDLLGSAGINLADGLCLGALISMNVVWNCDFDQFNVGDDPKSNKHCRPEFTFVRLQDPYSEISDGFSTAQALYNKDSSTGLYTRDVWKRYGIFLGVQVSGVGMGFNWGYFFASIVGGIVVMFLTRFICDWVAMMVLDQWPGCGHVETQTIKLERHQGEIPIGKAKRGTDAETGLIRKKSLRKDEDSDSEDDELPPRPALG